MVTLLAALSLPGVVIQDLGIDVASWLSAVLAVVPFVIWIATVLIAHVESPVPTLLVVGGSYGLALGVTHNLLRTPPPVEHLRLEEGHVEVVLRLAVFVSSVFTGFMIGLVAGLLTVAVRLLRSRLASPRQGPSSKPQAGHAGHD